VERGIVELVTHLVFQLALILLVAKVAGEVCEKYLRQPAVLGELIAGMIIGPYALGGLIEIPHLGPLFPPPSNPSVIPGSLSIIPVSSELYSIGQIAAIVLLFYAGLETDLGKFIRYGVSASIVALGGVVAPFILGSYATVYFGFADSFTHPVALFMGAIMTATSVGITARVLSDMDKLDTPEGVTILAAAVIDDVLGILVLTIVVSLAQTGVISYGKLATISFKAIGFWLAMTFLGILLSRWISKFLNSFKTEGASLALAVSLAFFISGLAEMFGLAMIIGAYSIGLALSRSEIADSLKERLHPVYNVLVPIFFVVMGMLVDFSAMGGALLFGAVISVSAILGKVLGCGFPALAVGFNRTGATRIGIGMLPRGEVALIVAGVGLARGAIGNTIFGVAIMMTVITTLLAPILLVPAFRRGKQGRRGQTGGKRSKALA